MILIMNVWLKMSKTWSILQRFQVSVRSVNRFPVFRLWKRNRKMGWTQRRCQVIGKIQIFKRHLVIGLVNFGLQSFFSGCSWRQKCSWRFNYSWRQNCSWKKNFYLEKNVHEEKTAQKSKILLKEKIVHEGKNNFF